MEKLIFVKEDHVYEVNNFLELGWKVKFITPFFENVSAGSFSVNGAYGAYVVLEKS